MARKRATYDDLLKLPEHLVGEIIDGELIASPRPAPPHAVASSALGALVGGPFGFGSGGGPGGWWIVDEPELHFGPDVVVPDLAGWRRQRMPRMPSTAFFELAPDWICEVVSPTTAKIDRSRKMDIYARAEVAYAWLIDPLAKTLEVYKLDGKQWVRRAAYVGDERPRAEPFDAIELELAALWLPDN